jgi:hypothetical protein
MAPRRAAGKELRQQTQPILSLELKVEALRTKQHLVQMRLGWFFDIYIQGKITTSSVELS